MGSVDYPFVGSVDQGGQLTGYPKDYCYFAGDCLANPIIFLFHVFGKLCLLCLSHSPGRMGKAQVLILCLKSTILQLFIRHDKASPSVLVEEKTTLSIKIIEWPR